MYFVVQLGEISVKYIQKVGNAETVLLEDFKR